MTTTNDLYKKINEGADLDEVRNEIISLIKQALDDFGENINNCQKSYISRAIGNLHANIAQKQKESEDRLRLCLSEIDHAFTPEDERDDNYIKNTDELNKITHQNLVNAINSLQ